MPPFPAFSAATFNDDVSGGDRAVVLCSRYLPESMEALRCSLCQPSFTFVRCLIACTFSERAHNVHSDGGGGGGAYDACRSAVLRMLRTSVHASGELAATGPASALDDGLCPEASASPLPTEMEVEVEVVHAQLPVQLCPLGTDAFLLPIGDADRLLACDLADGAAGAQGDRAAPVAPAGAPAGGATGGGELGWSDLPAQTQDSLGSVAAALAGMLSAAGIKPSLFALGSAGLLVARQVQQHLPPAPAAAAGASLLLIDRSLDMVSPCMHTDHPLHPLLSPSEPPPTAAEPAAAAEPPAASSTGADAVSDDVAGPARALGTALACAESSCSSLVDSLLARRGKEVQQLLLKSLAEIVDDEALDHVPLPSKPTLPKLRELLRAVSSDDAVAWRHASALSAVQQLIDVADRRAAPRPPLCYPPRFHQSPRSPPRTCPAPHSPRPALSLAPFPAPSPAPSRDPPPPAAARRPKSPSCSPPRSSSSTPPPTRSPPRTPS